MGTGTEPCVLISSKFYTDLDKVRKINICNDNRENNFEKFDNNQHQNFNYGPYIIHLSEKEKEIEALGLGSIAFSYLPDPNPINETRTNNQPKIKTGWKRYIGVVLAIVATVAYSLATLIVKFCDKYHPFTLSFWRFQGILIPAIPILLYSHLIAKKPVFASIWPLNSPDKWKIIGALIIRSIMGCTSTVCHISSLQYIEMPDASIIAFSCPVFVTLFAHLFLGEKCGITPFIVSLTTLSGVVIITRPPMLTNGQEFNENILVGTGLAFFSMILGCGVLIFIRHLRSIHFSFMMFTYGLIATIECATIAYCQNVLELPSTKQDWIYCILLVFLTFVQQICIIAALKYEEASPVALIQSCDVIFAFLWQLIFLSIIPDIFSLGGSSIVISGVLITTFRKWLMSLPEEHEIRRRFKLLLV